MVNGLLVQDLFDAPSPNRAFWTIAIEAQLYLVFPLLLLMIRRVNAVAMLATVTAAVVGVLLLAPAVPLFNATAIRLEIDFAALFATGIVAAGIVSASHRLRAWPWHWLAFAAAAPVVAAIAWMGSVWTITNFFWIDLALGPAIGCLLAALGSFTGARQARTENAGSRPAPLVRVLDTRPLRSLGSFSYSLYLTHAPIVVLVNEFVVADRIRQGVPSFLVSIAIVIPVSIVAARAFSAVFEAPFLRHRTWPALRAAMASRLRRADAPQPSTSDA